MSDNFEIRKKNDRMNNSDYLIDDDKTSVTDDKLNQDWNPLEQETKKRDYTKIINEKIDVDSIPDIDEPSYEAPSIDEIFNGDMSGKDDPIKSSGSNMKSSNSDMLGNSFDNDEKKQAAEQTAEMILDAWDGLHKLGAKWCMIKEDQLVELHLEDKISLETEIPISENETVPLINYAKSFNQEVKDTIKPDAEFNKQVKPALTRVLMKRNLVLGDEGFLIYKFAKAGTETVGAIIGLKMAVNKMLKHLQNQHQNNKSNAGVESPEVIVSEFESSEINA